MALLDTTVFVDLGGRGGKKRYAEAEGVLRHLLASGQGIFTSRMNIAELYVGAELSNDPIIGRKEIADYMNWISVIEFDDRATEEYGRIRADLQRRGQLVGDLDMLIAACASANGQAVVTRNVAHFNRVTGLQVIAYGT